MSPCRRATGSDAPRHSAKVSGPFVARDTFVVQFDVNVTDKTSNKRMQMSEIGIYAAKDGKVAREEFLPLAQRKEWREAAFVDKP